MPAKVVWALTPSDCRCRNWDGSDELASIKDELATLKSPELEAQKQAERAREEEECREQEREKRTNNILRVAAHRCAIGQSPKRSAPMSALRPH
eukprot:5523863-Prymnesium_polylepis.2